MEKQNRHQKSDNYSVIASEIVPHLDEIHHDGEFITWLESEAPLRSKFPDADVRLSQARKIFRFHAQKLSEFAHHPYSIVYPFAGSDFATPFQIGATRAYLCDKRPFFCFPSKARNSRSRGNFISEELEKNANKNNLFMFLLGFGSRSKADNSERSPAAYIGILQLKLLLDAKLFEFSRCQGGELVISFMMPDVGIKTIHFFENTRLGNFKFEGNDNDSTFYDAITRATPACVLVKKSMDLASHMRPFWRSIGSRSVVLADQAKGVIFSCLHLQDRTPTAKLDITLLAENFLRYFEGEDSRDVDFEVEYAAGRFGYDGKVYLYSSSQFSCCRSY